MSESLMGFAEAVYQKRNPLTGEFERVEFDQKGFGLTYGKTQDGYFVVQTGNAVADAVVSVFLNEVGIDNFSNAISAVKGGQYGRAALQSLYGVTQAGLTLIPGVNVIYAKTRGAMLAARAGGGIGRTLGSRLLNVPAGARYALNRAGQQPTLIAAIRSLVPRYGSSARQLRLARQQGLQVTPTGFTGTVSTGILPPTALTPQALAGQLSFPQTVAGSVPAPALRGSSLERSGLVRRRVREQMQASIAAPGAPPAWTQRGRYFFGADPVKGAVGTGTGFGNSPAARTLRQAGLAGAGGLTLSARGAQAEDEARATERAAITSISAESEAADVVRRNSVQEEIDAALAEIQAGGGGDQAKAELEKDFNSTIGALNFQYDKTVNELRSMYQLSETEDEQRRIRFMLADIEAQADAGRRAIENVYTRKREEVQRLTEVSRENSIKSAQKAFDLYTVSAGQLRDMLESDRQQTAQNVAGFGAAAPRDQSEYVQLLSSMAPVASESRQAIGDIGTAGLEWMGATMGEQSAARQGDLQRLSMSTRAAAISQHQQAVDKRVNTERLALADAIATLRNRQASESGAMERAMLSNQDNQVFSPVDVQAIVTQAAMQTGSAARAIEQYRIYFAGKPNPLGGVYPQEPPKFVIDAINETVNEYRAAMELMQRENALKEQEVSQFERSFSPSPATGGGS